MTARSDYDEIGFCGYPFVDRIIGCRVAGVEGDENVDFADLVTLDAADDEFHSVKTGCRPDAVA